MRVIGISGLCAGKDTFFVTATFILKRINL